MALLLERASKLRSGGLSSRPAPNTYITSIINPSEGYELRGSLAAEFPTNVEAKS